MDHSQTYQEYITVSTDHIRDVDGCVLEPHHQLHHVDVAGRRGVMERGLSVPVLVDGGRTALEKCTTSDVCGEGIWNETPKLPPGITLP